MVRIPEKALTGVPPLPRVSPFPAPAAERVSPRLVDGFSPPPAGTFSNKTELEWLAVLDQAGAHVALSPEKAESLSLAQLAKHDLPFRFEQMARLLEELPADVRPSDSDAIRVTRKSVEAFRNNLDVFAPVYLGGKKEKWKALRSDVDKLYESLGAYKDLHQTEQLLGYPPGTLASEGEALLKRLNRAKAALISPKKSEGHRELLLNPRNKKLADEPTGKLSRFFWGGTELAPNAKLTGMGNIRDLARSRLDRALDVYPTVLRSSDLANPATSKQFHDFRKTARSFINLASYFPELFQGRGTLPVLRKLYGVVFEYGEIQDRLAALDVLRASNRPEDAAKLATEINQRWTELVAWQKRERVDELLSALIARLP